MVFCLNLSAQDFYNDPKSLFVIPAETPGEEVTNDNQLIQRLVNSYKYAVKKQSSLGNSMWQVFFNQRHVELHNTFMNGSIDQVSYFLKNPAKSDLFYGFDNLAISLLPNLNKAKFSKLPLDSLGEAAKALGLLSKENLDPKTWRTDEIIELFENAYNIDIYFPNPFPLEYGAESSKGVISYRAAQALYQAILIKKLTEGIKNPKILEIGAGLGRTAYYANLLGIKDYTIVDIPFTAMSSSYFLARVLGQQQILFAGENGKNKSNLVKFLTPADFLSETTKYDLIINVDSFTEMDKRVAQKYWDKIEISTPIFLSINHERNKFKVTDFVLKSKEVTNYSKYDYALRKKYFEEVIYFK